MTRSSLPDPGASAQLAQAAPIPGNDPAAVDLWAARAGRRNGKTVIFTEWMRHRFGGAADGGLS